MSLIGLFLDCTSLIGQCMLWADLQSMMGNGWPGCRVMLVTPGSWTMYTGPKIDNLYLTLKKIESYLAAVAAVVE